ncbi:MAG: 3-phosphoshikimate 1-carboxyvinyltransferase [Candidatus Hydrogenedentota bacterium]
MKLVVDKTDTISGEAEIPASKSHTIRAVVFASLAEGTSILTYPLESEDTKSAINACINLGAKINKKDKKIEITGFAGVPDVINDKIDTLNSGTTTNIISSVAALCDKTINIDGDESIRRRPIQPLLDAINNLGAKAISLKNNGCPPLQIKGRLKGGKTELDCKSSQYLTSLLITAPLLSQDTRITVKNICEKPYIDMTLSWLDELGIQYENRNYDTFIIHRNQKYKAFQKQIPSDWSSATFLLVAGVMAGKDLIIKGLDLTDTQADKEVLSYLLKMGADIKLKENEIIINKSELQGFELDLNNTPDALPAMSVLGCYAKGKTTLKNVAHARIKETDRIKVMASELSKMGANIKELPDGLLILHSRLKGCEVNGYNDHRVVMALSLAGMIASNKTIIDTQEAINVTFPSYIELMNSLGTSFAIV